MRNSKGEITRFLLPGVIALAAVCSVLPSIATASPSCEEVFEDQAARLHRKIESLADLIIKTEQLRAKNSDIWTLLDENVRFKEKELSQIGVPKSEIAKAIQRRLGRQKDEARIRVEEEETAKTEQEKKLHPFETELQMKGLLVGSFPLRFVKSPGFTGYLLAKNTPILQLYGGVPRQLIAERELPKEGGNYWTSTRDGKLVAIASGQAGEGIRIFEFATWKEVASLPFAGQPLLLEFSPDDKHLVAIGHGEGQPLAPSTARVYDLEKRELVAETTSVGGAQQPNHFRWSTDGKFIIGRSWRWNWRANQLTSLKKGAQNVGFTLSNNGEMYVFSHETQPNGRNPPIVTVREVGSDKVIDSFPVNVVSSLSGVAFSEDDKSLVLLFRGGHIVIRDLAARSSIGPAQTGVVEGYVAISPNGRNISVHGKAPESSMNQRRVIVDPQTLEVLRDRPSVNWPGETAIFSEDGSDLFIHAFGLGTLYSD